MANVETPRPDEKLGIFGIEKLNFLNIPHQKLVNLAEEIGMPQHDLAQELWLSDSYEAKLLSCMFSEPSKITEEMADELAQGLDSWIICDYCCSKLLFKLPFAMKKALAWADAKSNVISCVGFNLIAALAANLPKDADEELGFFDSALFYTRKHAANEDAHVRRAICRALRNIGRRGKYWHDAAVETADEIGAQPSEAARWVASQSLGELMSTKLTSILTD
jgi:3-methyladenine DNA glycosylase AlkD